MVCFFLFFSDDMSTPHMVAPQSHSSNSVEVSDNMITILKQLATDTFQNECRKLVKALESQQSSLVSLRSLINQCIYQESYMSFLFYCIY